MPDTAVFDAGGYRYVRGPFQYSAGVAAEPGYAIERVRLARPVPVAEGFAMIERHLAHCARPLTAFCACELRSPAPFDDDGFRAFNRLYVGTLERWGIFRDEENPVARSNVCPEIGAPAEPSFHAFSYTVESAGSEQRDFVVAGSGEATEGAGSYRERTVRAGETGPDALREKACFVLGEMERRLAALGVEWSRASATQVYTVHDLHPFLADEIVARGAVPAGLTWYFARPPVAGLEFEMDVRGVSIERLV